MNMAWTLTAIFELKSANSFNVLEIWLDIVTDFELGNLLWNKLEMEQEYPIIWFQPDVKSLRELVYCYAVTVIQLPTFIITSLVI